jgi:hypothetical protein
LSSSDQCRRRPPSSAAKISIGETVEAHAIRQCLTTICSIRADGLHRRLTPPPFKPRNNAPHNTSLCTCLSRSDPDQAGGANRAAAPKPSGNPQNLPLGFRSLMDAVGFFRVHGACRGQNSQFEASKEPAGRPLRLFLIKQ